jgi:hypothetical protein
MKFDIIENKTMLNDKINLLSNILTFGEDVQIREYILIDTTCEMLPSVISYVAYGTPNYADRILKFNHISNPYSIKTGMILMIPDITSFDNKKKHINATEIKNQKQKITKLSDVVNNIQTTATQQSLTSPSKKRISGKNFTKSNGVLRF